MSRVIQATGSSACISTPNSSWEGPTTTGRSPFLGFWPRRRRFPGSLLELTLSVKFICVAFRAFEEHAAAILPVSAAGRPGAGSPTAPWWLAFEAAYHAEEKVAFEHISCASYLHARVSLGAHMQCRGAHSQGACQRRLGCVHARVEPECLRCLAVLPAVLVRAVPAAPSALPRHVQRVNECGSELIF